MHSQCKDALHKCLAAPLAKDCTSKGLCVRMHCKMNQDTVACLLCTQMHVDALQMHTLEQRLDTASTALQHLDTKHLLPAGGTSTNRTSTLRTSCSMGTSSPTSSSAGCIGKTSNLVEPHSQPAHSKDAGHVNSQL